MKYKKLIGIVLALSACLLSACNQSAPTASYAPATTAVIEPQIKDPGWYGSTPLIHTIDLPDTIALQEFMYDDSEYQKFVGYDGLNAEQVLAYDHLRSTLRERGILIPSCYDQHEPKLTLFPEVRYEDVGVKYECTCDGERVLYFIYYLKSGYENPSSMREYWNLRFGSQYVADATQLTIERNGKQVSAHIHAHNSGKAISFAENGFQIKIIYYGEKDLKTLAETFEYGLSHLNENN